MEILNFSFPNVDKNRIVICININFLDQFIFGGKMKTFCLALLSYGLGWVRPGLSGLFQACPGQLESVWVYPDLSRSARVCRICPGPF